ncbi:MAG: hypothetical protein HOW73_48955 [Polyangiaceae bacterium]|nr:hypothetical protein [Polyangiaceae bacterium]
MPEIRFRLCASCGHETSARQCAGCGADGSRTRWSQRPDQPDNRYELHDELTGTTGYIIVRRGKPVEGAAHRRSLHALRAVDLADDFRAFSSVHVVPYPHEVEASNARDVATGAFIGAIIGLVARGLVEVAFECWTGWERRGPFVLPVTIQGRGDVSVRKAASFASEGPPLERALLVAIDAAPEGHTYRKHEHRWQSLRDVVHRASVDLPTFGDLVHGATLLPFGYEPLLEQFARHYPQLISSLSELAETLLVRHQSR